MGRINYISDDLLRVMRRELKKHGVTLVRNRKTGAVYVRHITTHPAPPVTEARTIARADFTERSRRASEWIKSNSPEACPPYGTPEYQKMMKSFKRQSKIKRFPNFVMSRIDRT